MAIANHMADALRERIKTGAFIAMPSCFDALSAKMIEQAGFSVTFMSGFAASAARLGQPDLGLMSYSEVLDQARNLAQQGAKIDVFTDPVQAVAGAQAVYTDVWASMGQEQEQAEREKAFHGFCLNEDLLAEADSRAIVLHCLPAHRGEEISVGVMEGPASRIFDQAENRLHAQQALLAALMGGL